MDLLKAGLQSIRAIQADFNFGDIGFATGEADKILFSSELTVGEETVPAPPTNPVSRPGDIWVLGDHRVGCGDTRDLEFLRRVCGPEPIDAANLDVPYNKKMNGDAVSRGRHREFLLASGEMPTADFRRFLHDGLGNCAQVSRDGAVHFVWIDHRHVEDLAEACQGVYGERLNICVWKKSNAGMGSLYRSRHELVFVMRVGKAAHINNVELGKHGRNRTNVWEYELVNTLRGARRADLDLHPTTKPVALVADAILDVTRPNDLVLDGYLGSGSTLLACVRTGRRCRAWRLIRSMWISP